MVKISDGSEIGLDLYKLSVAEYRSMFDGAEAETEAVAKVTGLTVDQVTALPWPDYRQIVAALVKAAREPLADPN